MGMNDSKNLNKSEPFRIVRYKIGWASGGSGQWTSFGKATVVINGGHSFALDSKNYEFIKYKKGIITPEFIIFSIFSAAALFFNILVHSFEQIPVAPKIICGIILAVTIIPIIVSLFRSPKRIIFKINSTEFITLYFESNRDRQKFLQYLAKFTDNAEAESTVEKAFCAYDADVVFNTFDAENEKSKTSAKVNVENGRIKIIADSDKKIYTDYFSKSHDLLWQLYPFASVFILMPVFAIFSSIQSGSFEPAILFVLIFLVAGIFVMFVPSIISRGKLLLLNREGYIRLSFLDSKTRKKFEQDIKYLKDYKRTAYGFSNIRAKEELKQFKVFNIAKYKFPIGLIIATVIYLAFIAGLIASLDYIIILIGTYLGFVFYSFFYIFYKDIMRQNYVIWLRKRRLRDSDLVTAEITDYSVKDFRRGGRYFFNVAITTEHIQNGERKINKFCKNMQKGFLDYHAGQKLTLAVSERTVSLLTDSSMPVITVPTNDIRFPEYDGANLGKKIIDALKPSARKAVDTAKPYRILGQLKIKLLAYALSAAPIGCMAVLFTWIFIGTADSVTKTVSAVLFPIMTLLFALCITIFIKHLAQLFCSKSIVKNGMLTKAFIMHLHTIIKEVRSSNSHRIIYTYYFKIAYFNEHSELKTGYVCESIHTNFSGYGLPDIKENSFINICTLNGRYTVLLKFSEIKMY